MTEGAVRVISKSVLFGLVGAVVAALLWIAATVILPMFLPYVVGRISGTGAVGVGYVTSDSILLVALIGFVVAFAWKWYQLRG